MASTACNYDPNAEKESYGCLYKIGHVTFFQNPHVGHIAVTINGTTDTLKHPSWDSPCDYYQSPQCGAVKFIDLCPGTYNYSAVGPSKTWSGTITITQINSQNGAYCECNPVELK